MTKDVKHIVAQVRGPVAEQVIYTAVYTYGDSGPWFGTGMWHLTEAKVMEDLTNYASAQSIHIVSAKVPLPSPPVEKE